MKLNIRAKISVISLIVAVFFVSIGAFNLFEMNKLNQNGKFLRSNTIASIEWIHSIQTDMVQFRTKQVQLVIATTNQEMDQFAAELDSAATAINTKLEAYQIGLSDVEEQAAYDQFTAVWTEYLKLNDLVEDNTRALNGPASIALLNGVGLSQYSRLNSILESWSGHIQSIADQFIQNSDHEYQTSLIFVIAFTIAATLITTGIGFYIADSLSKGAQLMVKAADEISEVDLALFSQAIQSVANGDLNALVTINTDELVYTSSDELGILARSFNRMIVQLKETGQTFSGMTANLKFLINVSSV